MRYANILETIGNTPLVELKSLNPRPGVQLFAKLEGTNPSGSIKDRIAKKMVEQAEAQHLLTSDSILLEPTSGNAGVALALVANQWCCVRSGLARGHFYGSWQDCDYPGRWRLEVHKRGPLEDKTPVRCCGR